MTGQFPSQINHTFQVLIPKLGISTKPRDCRPISLCNITYKLITKILVVQEMVHYMKKTRSYMGVVGIKLDMEKTFDRMEWSFLHQILLHLGFSTKWCQLINYCVSTAFISMLLNGVPMEPIIPTRGLRQDDCIIFTRGNTRSMVNLGESSVFFQ